MSEKHFQKIFEKLTIFLNFIKMIIKKIILKYDDFFPFDWQKNWEGEVEREKAKK